MKKKELLKMRKLNATPKMQQLVRDDRGIEKIINHFYDSGREIYVVHERYIYYRATVQNGILKLAIFQRQELAAGNLNPQFELYLSKEEEKWLTYEPSEKRWLTAKIDMLPYKTEKGQQYGNKPWSSEHTKAIVNQYLDSREKEVREAILDYQWSKLKDRRYRKHKKETDAIDAVMNAVPELPKDFDQWVIKSAFARQKQIFYKAKEMEGYCTHCNTEVKLKIRPYHNTQGKCPNCHQEVTMKSWKKQKYMVQETDVGILQRLSDNSGCYILRKFHCKLEWTIEKDWRLNFAGSWERYRCRLDERFSVVEGFEFGEYKNTGIRRWCHDLYHGYYYGGCYNSTNCVLYGRNLKRLLQDTDLKYIPVGKLLKKNEGRNIEPDRLLKNLLQYPKTEFLIKANLYQMVWDAMKVYEVKEDFDWNAKRPWDLLRITKDQMHLCIKRNFSLEELRILQEANNCKVKLSPDQIRFFAEIGMQRTKKSVFTYGHPGKFQRYFLEELHVETSDQEIGDYMDYLDDLWELKIPIMQQELFPKNFQTIHGEIAQQRREYENKLAKADLRKKNKAFKNILPEIRELYSFQDDTFTVVFPTCKGDFQKEGQQMHNCVGGSYFDYMLRGDSVVFFLRRKEEPEKPYCTVEMKEERIVQCRAEYNKNAPDEAWDFMKKLAKQVQKRMNEKRKKQIKSLDEAI